MHVDDATGTKSPLTGDLYGPPAFAPMLRALLDVTSAQLGCALIACGGVFSTLQVEQALAAGAHAVQLDTVLWREVSLRA
jgi:dihydroorotate dehydrogenase